MEAFSLEMAGSDRRLGGIPYILTRAAEIHPDRVAIDDLLNGRRVTYAELERDTNRLAHALRELGVRKGDFVALMFPNEAAMAQAMFACAKIGAVICPVNVRLLPSPSIAGGSSGTRSPRERRLVQSATSFASAMPAMESRGAGSDLSE